MTKNRAHPLDRYFIRNTCGVSSVEFFWGLTLPVVVESTFLQIYLRSIGASGTAIGLIPSIYALFLALCAPVSAMLTSHLIHKRRAVILAHIAGSIPFILYGVLVAAAPAAGTPLVFLLLYAAYSAFMGITIPIWQNYLMRIFSPEKTFSALSMMFVVQVAARLAGGFAIAGAVKLFAFSPRGAAIAFICTGLSFLIGSCFFFITHEETDGRSRAREQAHSFRSLFTTAKKIIRERNFVFLQLSTLESAACITVISFYANYAVELRGINTATAAGLFAVCLYAGGVAANITLGSFNLLPLKGKFLVSKLFALAGVFLILFAHSPLPFLAASFCIGVSRGISQLAFSPAIKAISGLDDSTDYFSIAPLFMLPFALGIPWTAGFVIEHHAHAGAVPYMAVFSAMGIIIAASVLFLMPVDFEGTRRRIKDGR